VYDLRTTPTPPPSCAIGPKKNAPGASEAAKAEAKARNAEAAKPKEPPKPAENDKAQ